MEDETDKKTGSDGEARRTLPPLQPSPSLGEGVAAQNPPPPTRGRIEEGEASEDSQPTEPERPQFEALLYPHRSLSYRGFLALTIGTFVIVAAYGGLFLVLGAWPIFGFLGAEWLLFWWLLRTHFRGDRRAERIRLYADRLVLQQIDAKGRVAESAFEPYWLQVVLKERGFEDPALLLRSHGRAVEIGTFLGAGERRQFAQELQTILTRWRAI
jgi:uncharacterized membrane protein